MDREASLELMREAHKALKAELDAITRLQVALQQVYYATFERVEAAGKLRRRADNPKVIFDTTEIEQRIEKVAAGEEAVATSYREFMEGIDRLPIAAREAAVKALKGWRET